MKNLQKIFIVAAATLLPISALAINPSESFTVANSDEQDLPSPLTTFETVDGTAFPGGWLTVGYVDGWGGTGLLTAEQIKDGFRFVRSTVGLSEKESDTPYATLENDGLLESAAWTVNDDVVGTARLVVLVGNGTSFKSADNTEIAALTFSAGNAASLTWEELQYDDHLYIDFIDETLDFRPDVVFGSVAGTTLTLAAIPEPSMFGLLAGLGALALVGSRRRRK